MDLERIKLQKWHDFHKIPSGEKYWGIKYVLVKLHNGNDFTSWEDLKLTLIDIQNQAW